MVLTHFLREQTRKLREQREERERQVEEILAQGHAQGHAEGRAEAQAEWLAWNQRRLTAERAGHPFDEPPPASV